MGAKNRIRIYAGQYYDAETGLHYNGYRYYDPNLGRYLRPDPIGIDGGINLYVYVQNNPISNFDNFGLMSQAQCEIWCNVRGAAKIAALAHSVTLQKARCLWESKGNPFKMAKCIKDATDRLIKDVAKIEKWIRDCVEGCKPRCPGNDFGNRSFPPSPGRG